MTVTSSEKGFENAPCKNQPWWSTLIATILLAAFGASNGDAQTYTVTNNSDSGAGSLRQAITNLNAGTSGATIAFNISGSKTISPASALPAIQKSVMINPVNVAGIVLNGSGAGFSHGLVFQENTGNFSSLKGLTIQNFQRSGVLIAPANSSEKVTIDTCNIKLCSADGVTISGGQNHFITGNTVLESNSGYGLNITGSSVQGVQMVEGALQGNQLGGVRFVGTNNEVRSVLIVSNGSTESSDHRGGVIVGGASIATNCRTRGCTIAGNTPWGLKRLSGSTGEARDNETYLNSQSGFKVLGAAPSIVLRSFVVDSTHGQIVIAGTVTSNPNTSIGVEFFVPSDPPPYNQGSAYLSAADLTVTTDSSGSATFFHTFSRNASYNGLADPRVTQHPPVFAIDSTDTIVATATSSTAGTSEFTSPSVATLPGDFDLDGYGTGSDLLIWQRNLGKTNAKYWEGDADFDGDVDSSDKAIMDANFP